MIALLPSVVGSTTLKQAYSFVSQTLARGLPISGLLSAVDAMPARTLRPGRAVGARRQTLRSWIGLWTTINLKQLHDNLVRAWTLSI